MPNPSKRPGVSVRHIRCALTAVRSWLDHAGSASISRDAYIHLSWYISGTAAVPGGSRAPDLASCREDREIASRKSDGDGKYHPRCLSFGAPGPAINRRPQPRNRTNARHGNKVRWRPREDEPAPQARELHLTRARRTCSSPRGSANRPWRELMPPSGTQPTS